MNWKYDRHTMTMNILYLELVKNFCEIIIAINRLFTFNGINCGRIFSKVTENPAEKKQSAMLLWIFPPKSMPTRSFKNQTMKYILYVSQLYWVCWISWMKQFLGFGVYNRKCQKPQQFWEWMNSLCHSANLNIGQYCGFIIIHWCKSDDLKFFAGFYLK